jgi:outer membrane protein assembly factor BamB
VLAPGNGVAYLKRGGQWTRMAKGRFPDADHWTHADYDATGNAVTKDRRVAPPQQLQWMTGLQTTIASSSIPGYGNSSSFRISNGRVYADWLFRDPARRHGAWDAHNGLPLWSQESPPSMNRRMYHTVADGDRVFTYLKTAGPLVALDLRTGATVRTYDKVKPMASGWSAFVHLRFAKNKLISANMSELTALDPDTGNILWSASEPSGLFFGLSVDAAAGRVYVVLSDEPADTRVESRWPSVRAKELLAYDFETGKPVWRSQEVAGRFIGQAIAAGPYVGLFGPNGIGANRNKSINAGFVGNVRASDGKLLWQNPFSMIAEGWGLSMLWRDGAMYFSLPWRFLRVDAATGEQTHVFGRSYNGRCMRFAATPNYFLHSFVAWVDKDFNGVMQSVARSSCSNSVYPANGMAYFTPSACGCFTNLRGYLALTPEATLPPVADAERLEKSGARAWAADDTGKLPVPGGLVVENATKYAGAPPAELAPVAAAAGRSIVVIPFRHRVEARNEGGKAQWAFTADARITTPPIVQDGLVIFGAHDGRVYALREDGTLAWRFLAARAERLVPVFGQLESSWPVHNVVLLGGKVFVSAGRHAELGGGISVWGLDPKTGDVLVKRQLQKTPVVIKGTGSVSSIAAYGALNGVLRVENNNLVLPSGRGVPFTFDPVAATDDDWA